MKYFKELLVIATIIVAVTCADDIEGFHPGPPIPITVVPTSPEPTNPPPTHSTSTSTIAPTPKPSPTTKPTALTTTQTPKPTASPTTSKPTAPSTTAKPTAPPTTSKPTAPPTTSKPTAPPTTSKPTAPPTTPKPTPKPAEVQTWTVNITGNHSCIVLKSAMEIKIANFTFNVPKDANSTGSCDNNEYLKLSWIEPYNVMASIKFKFDVNKTTSRFDVELIEVNITGEGENYHLVHNKEEFATGLKNSYKCDTQNIDLKDMVNVNGTAGHLILTEFQVQAYQNSTGTFSEAVNCVSTSIPDVVPIAVGCALIVLIMMILIAYLVGRRRNQARGYLSMFAETKKEEDYIPMKTISCFN